MDNIAELRRRGIDVLKRALAVEMLGQNRTVSDMVELRDAYLPWVVDVREALGSTDMGGKVLLSEDTASIFTATKAFGADPDPTFLDRVLQAIIDGTRHRQAVLQEYSQVAIFRVSTTDKEYTTFSYRDIPGKLLSRNRPSTHVLEYVAKHIDPIGNAKILKKDLWDYLVGQDEKFDFAGGMIKSSENARRQSLNRYIQQARTELKAMYNLPAITLELTKGSRYLLVHFP